MSRPDNDFDLLLIDREFCEFDLLLDRDLKHCNTCDQDKPVGREHWYFSAGKMMSGPCKECRKAYARRDYAGNSEKWNARAKRYREENPESYKESMKRSREKRPEVIKAIAQRNYQKNRDDRIAYERERRESGIASAQERARRAADPEKYREKERRRRRPPERRQRDASIMRAARAADPERFRGYDAKRYAPPKGNLNRRVASSLTSALRKRGLRKSLPKAMITGWSIDELMRHLEVLFEPGMSFDNYGEWDVDHIVPLSRIPYTGEADPRFMEAWALSNLAPLWAPDNGSKHARLDWELPNYYVNPALRAMYENRNLELLAA